MEQVTIDWSQLRTHGDAPWRSFETFCYQVARREYGDYGRFTYPEAAPGSEFYLHLHRDCDLGSAGDVIGWQAKFFLPHESLEVTYRKARAKWSLGSRARQIEDSLAKACKAEPALHRWIVCTPRKFTTTELRWFEESLAEAVPGIILDRWDEVDFQMYLIDPGFVGIRHYFFGSLELSPEWFRQQLENAIAGLRDVFLPEVHTDTRVEGAIHAVLGDREFQERLQDAVGRLRAAHADMVRAHAGLERAKDRVRDAGDEVAERLASALEWAGGVHSAQGNAIERLDGLAVLLGDGDLPAARAGAAELPSLEVGGESEDFGDVLLEMPRAMARAERDESLASAVHYVRSAYQAVLEFHATWREVVSWTDGISQSRAVILGGAAVGKSHLAAHLCSERTEVGLPALLLLGGSFTRNDSIEERIRLCCDVAPAVAWEEFLGALETAAAVNRTRLPIVIDGLNDSQDVEIWRKGVDVLGKSVSRHPHLVLILTCRTTYREAIWGSEGPGDTLGLAGFEGAEVEHAAERYFAHYRLDADLTFAPLERFTHPLFLRIFCETQNRERNEIKHVAMSEQTLHSVFDRFLDQMENRVCLKLGKDAKTHPVRGRLERLAEQLWREGRREIPRGKAKVLFGDDEDEWEGTYTKAMVDEGLVLHREWSDGEEGLGFTYDLLAGYLIARHLVLRNRDDLPAFLESPEVQDKLLTDDVWNRHPLWEDVITSLGILAPVSTGQHLWQVASHDELRSAGLHSLFQIEPEHVGPESVEAIKRAFSHPPNRDALFDLALPVATWADHPLNAKLWTALLAQLSMPERDQSWTECVRGRATEFLRYIDRFEGQCRAAEEMVGGGDEVALSQIRHLQLKAHCAQWLLTSTHRELRDKATRALYWFGRAFPDTLFCMAGDSLAINDPYVPERMIAAAYGVTMALHYCTDRADFQEEALPVFAQRLYDRLFAPGAPYATTHNLLRDYAWHTLAIAQELHPSLFSPCEAQHCRPPFSDMAREWGESTDRDEHRYRDGSAPLQMDFENYTIGRLVPDRRNYDMEHPEYQRVLGQVRWRIYGLGYSLEAFGTMDAEIARGRWGRSVQPDVERYGKKYSWIAYHELAGAREDAGAPRYEHSHPCERMPDVHIDPSFPEPAPAVDVVNVDWTAEGPGDLSKWIESGPKPDLGDVLRRPSLLNETGPWILLEGFVCQDAPERKRRVLLHLRALLMDPVAARMLCEAAESSPSSNALAEHSLPADHYTFAGEIPWCETFGTEWRREDGTLRPIAGEESLDAMRRAPNGIITNGDGTTTTTEFLAHSFEWEAYHSETNAAGSASVPSPPMCDALGLESRPQTFGMFDAEGDRASITVGGGDAWGPRQDGLYLRLDLLRAYLQQTGRVMVWAVWGERALLLKDVAERKALAEEFPQRFSQFTDIVRLEDIVRL